MAGAAARSSTWRGLAKIAALGCICLTFDLRGHARTSEQHENVTREDNLRDVVAAYDALMRQRGVDPTVDRRGRQQLRRLSGSILTSLRPVRWLGCVLRRSIGTRIGRYRSGSSTARISPHTGDTWYGQRIIGRCVPAPPLKVMCWSLS